MAGLSPIHGPTFVSASIGRSDIFVGCGLSAGAKRAEMRLNSRLVWNAVCSAIGRVTTMSSIVPAPGTELHRVFETLMRSADANGHGTPLTLRDILESVEKAALHDALTRTCGNRARAARLLGTTERVFNYGVRKYGIDWRSYKR